MENTKTEQQHIQTNFMCQLFNSERLYKANANQRKILNKRNELVTQRPYHFRDHF